MPERTGILHLALSVLLLVADSNGGIWRHGIGSWPSPQGIPSRLWSAVMKGPNDRVPFPSGFLGEFHLRRPESERTSFLHCKHEGFFAIQGTCRGFYQCNLVPDSGIFSVSVHVCPPDTIFDDVLTTCILASQATARPKCKTRETNNQFDFVDTLSPFESEGDNRVNGVRSLLRNMNLGESSPLTRQKRQIPLSAGSLTHDFIFKAERGTNGVYSFIGGETSLDRIEDKLTGFKGMLENVSLSDLERKTERKIFRDITKLITDTSLRNIKCNFDKIQKLIYNGIIEDLAITTVLQGMISDESKLKESNLAEVKVALREVEEFIYQEIHESKTYIRKGFEMRSDSSTVSIIEPLVSKLLNLTIEFKQNLKHLQGLSERHQEIDIERSDGYEEYLQPSILQDTLYNIINRDLAIPKTDSDTTALAFLELLVQGLQVHVKLLSFAVSANVFSAVKALKDRDLEKFNVRMIRVHSAISRVRTSMGNRNSEGLISNIRALLNFVQELPHSSRIDGLLKLLNETKVEVDQIESHINQLIEGNVIIPKPDTVTEEPDFSASFISVPVGKWKMDIQVNYAIQLVSEKGLSKVSDWSKSYKILDKAHPTVHIPATEDGMTRIVYRKFNQEKPEIVAILTDHEVNSFRDLNRDLATAASGTDVDETLKEVRDLLGDGANVTVRFENEMTPLHYAAKYGHVGVMEILINETADIGAKSFEGEEPLHYAAFSGSEEAIRYLINNGANVNAQTKLLGLSPLHIAVANNHALSAKALIEGGAQVNINIQDTNGISPLHLAVASGNMDVLEVLLGSDHLDINAVTNGGLAALHIAAMVSEDLLVKKLLTLENIGLDSLSDSQISLIHLASINHNVDPIISIIQHDLPVAAVDKDGSTPLHYAAFYGNFRAVLVLILDHSLKDLLNNDNKSAIDVAMESNRDSIVDVLKSDIYNLSEFTLVELRDPTMNFSKELAEKIISGSDEICDHIGSVDSYVNLVKFMIPLHIYYGDQHSSSMIFKDYDRDLIAAQNHAKLWRDGDSIVNGIKNVFDLARKFESEFSRKYKINKNRIKAIQDNQIKEDTIRDREIKITLLNTEISQITDILSKVKDPDFKSYMKGQLTDKQKELDQKLREKTDTFLIESELREITDFLESVKFNTGRIREVANETKEKVQIFKGNLEQDMGAFKRHNGLAITAIIIFNIETIQDDQILAEMQEKRNKLKSQIRDHQREIRALERRIVETEKQQRERKRKLQDDISYYRKWEIFGWVTAPLLFGIPILIHARNEEAEYNQQLQATIKEFEDLISSLVTRVERMTTEITEYDEEFDIMNKSSEQIRNKRRQLIYLDRDLNTLISDSETLLQAIDKALVGITMIKDVFDSADQELDEMIFKAGTAGEEAERLKVKYFIYEEISTLEFNWREVHLKIVDLDDCTRNFRTTQPVV